MSSDNLMVHRASNVKIYFLHHTLNTLACDRSGRISSMIGSGQWMRFNALLSSLGSIHTRNVPLRFFTTTGLDTQWVGINWFDDSQAFQTNYFFQCHKYSPDRLTYWFYCDIYLSWSFFSKGPSSMKTSWNWGQNWWWHLAVIYFLFFL